MNGIFTRQLNYSYSSGTKALNNLCVHIKPGEIVGIIGRNGAGKSTFMRLINGLLKPSSGQVLVDGIPTSDYLSSELTRKVGVMFQNPEHQLFSDSVEQEINYSLKNLNLSKEEFDSRKQEIIDLLKLHDIIEKSPFNISGGQRKKVAIASILCRKPDYILFDEPTIGQDKYNRKMLERIIKDENQKNKTIIIISHDTEFIYRNTQRVLIFEKGEILADGPTKEIFRNKEILEKSAIIEPQVPLLMNKLQRNWEKTHPNQPNPIDFEKIYSYSQFEEEIYKKIEINKERTKN